MAVAGIGATLGAAYEGQTVDGASGTKNDVLFAKGFGSYTNNSFSAAGTDESGVANSTNNSGVTYALQVFNGSTGAVRGNQSSGAANFSARNTTSYDGYYISQVTLTVSGGTLDGSTANRSVVWFGSTAYANPNTSAPSTGTKVDSAEDASGQATLTWNNSNESYTYFCLYNLKTSGTALSANASTALVITWTEKTPLPSYTVTKDATHCTIDGSATLDGTANATYTISPDTNYNAPSLVTVTRGGETLSAETQYTYSVTDNVGTLVIPKAQITGNFVVTASAIATHAVTGDISNGSLDTATRVENGQDYSGTVVPSEHYSIPTGISVTMGGVPISEGTDPGEYMYDDTDGSIMVIGVTGDLVISASCPAVPSRGISVTVTGGTYSGDSIIYQGETAAIVIAPNEHYKLPASVSVTNATLDGYNGETGELVISNATGDVSVSAVCVAKANNEIDLSLTNVSGSLGNVTTLEEGDSADLVFSADDGYGLPDSVTVTGAESHSWSKATGTLHLVGGTEDITVTIAGVAKALSSISLSSDSGTFTLGDAFVMPTVTATFNLGPEDVTSFATYTGYDPFDVSAPQTVTISYTFGGTTKTASYTATVSNKTRSYVTRYSKVTDASDLEAGDKIVITAKDEPTAAMGAWPGSGNNIPQAETAPVVSEGKITTLNDAAELTLSTASAEDGTFYLADGSNYLYAASSSANHLKAADTPDAENGAWQFEYNNNGMSIVAFGSSNRNVMQYNSTSSLFSCYKTASQTALDVYKKEIVDVTVQSLVRLTATGPADNARKEEDILTPSDFVATALFDTGDQELVTPTITNGEGNSFALAAGENTINLSYTRDAITKNCSVVVVAAENTAELDGIVWSQESQAKTVFDGSAIGSFGTLQKHYDDDSTVALGVGDCTVAVYSMFGDVYTKEHDIASPADYAWSKANDDGKYLGVTYEGYTKYSGQISVVELLEDITGFSAQERTATWTEADSIALKNSGKNDDPINANIDANIAILGGGTGTKTRAWSDGIRFYSGSTITFTPSNGARIASIKLNSSGKTCSVAASEENGTYTITTPTAGAITFSGWTGSQTVSADIVVTYDIDVENENIANTDASVQKSVLDFVETMNSDLSVCSTYSLTPSIWTTLSGKFDTAKIGAGDSDAQTLFANMFKYAESDEDGDTLQQALARYDYIIKKYTTSTYADFLGRVAAGSIPMPVYNLNENVLAPDSSLPIVITILSTGVLTIGAITLIRKRRNED